MEFYKYSNTICMRVKRWLIGISIAIAAILAVACIAFFTLTSPAVKIFGWRELDMNKLNRIRQTVTIYDSEGDVLADGICSKNRIYTALEDIPEQTKAAFVSIEDKRFYSHGGIDYIRMLGAAKNNILSFEFKEGASTITQQLIKNTHLSNEKTFTRKFQEIRLAKQLEKEYSKDEILEAYLNVLYFGNNVYGIGQAARAYFNKNVSELDISESAALAGIINNPSRFNPVTNLAQAEKRRNIVLSRMVDNGKITKEQAEIEKKKELKVNKPRENPLSVYIENVIAETAEKLDCLPEEVFEKKPRVTANINKRLFDAIFSSMSDILLNGAHDFRAIIVDNVASEIICDLGNVYGTPTLLRQPGSAIKPFVSYAPALEKKSVYPVSIIKDERTDFNGYEPKNFGDTYYGNVTVAESLKYSLNIPAVKLTDMCGLPYSKSVASKFGLRFSDKDTGLAVALGGMTEGVTLKSLADAYATLARGGVYKKSEYVRSISIGEKTAYNKKSADGRHAVRTDTAFLLTDMLMKCAESGTAKKLSGFSNVAAKTGTVERGDKNCDAYCVAYTPRYTVAVWFGNDGEGKNIYGGKEPAAVAKTVLEILNDKSKFEVPNTVERLAIDNKKLLDEGIVYLASPELPKRYCKQEYFSKSNLPSKYSYPESSELPFEFNDFSEDFEEFEIVESLA